MEVYSIEELHNLIVNKEIDLDKYYEELFEEATLQQERLNAFVTITKDEALKNIKELDVKEDELLFLIIIASNLSCEYTNTFTSKPVN